MTGSVEIRPRERADDPRLVEIITSLEDVFVTTLESWRHYLDVRVRPDGAKPEVMVAERDGGVVGLAIFEVNAWAAGPGLYFADVGVYRPLWGQGIGSALWSELEPRLLACDPHRAYVQIPEDRPHSQQFAERRDFRRNGRAERISRLLVAEADLTGYEDVEERLGREGITIRSLAELGETDETFLRALHEMIEDAERDIPSSEPFRSTPYEVFRQNFLKWPGSSPSTYWVAVDGERPVGMANLSVRVSGRATNGLTGVMRRYRGRGIARALKLKTIEWARDHDIEFIDTGNDAENSRMLAINIRLGYKPLPAREEWVKTYRS